MQQAARVVRAREVRADDRGDRRRRTSVGGVAHEQRLGAGERVVAGAAVDHVVAEAAEDHVVAAGEARGRRAALFTSTPGVRRERGVAVERLGARRRRRSRIAALVAEDAVVAGAAGDPVVAGAADDVVVLGVAEEPVVAAAAVDRRRRRTRRGPRRRPAPSSSVTARTTIRAVGVVAVAKRRGRSDDADDVAVVADDRVRVASSAGRPRSPVAELIAVRRAGAAEDVVVAVRALVGASTS